MSNATLTGPRRAAASGRADSLVVFLHGYGADGNDLIALADPLAEHLPDTLFLAPNAPQRCTNNPMGYQWFPIPWLDGSDEAAMHAGFAAAKTALNDWLDAVIRDEGIAPERTVIVGFSQGTMMALEVIPRRRVPYAGIVGFSGKLLEPERLTEVVTRPQVLLVHGDADPMVPYDSMSAAADALTQAGFEVFTHTSPNTGHGIAPDGLGVALSFIRDRLGIRG